MEKWEIYDGLESKIVEVESVYEILEKYVNAIVIKRVG